MTATDSALARRIPLAEFEDSLDRGANPGTSTLSDAVSVLRSLVPYARRHRTSLYLGILAGSLSGICRLTTPWAAKTLLHVWWKPKKTPGLVGLIPDAWITPLFVGGFALLMVALGYFDYLRRLQFARFSIGWSRDLRSAAFASLDAIPRRRREAGAADLVTRLIADISRFKAFVKVALVYVVTNLILVAIAACVVSYHSPMIGLVFFAGMAAALCVALYGSRATRTAYQHHRDFEGRLAHSLAHTLEGAETEEHTSRMNRWSSSFEASEMWAEGLTTWATHVVAGGTIVLALLIGTHEVEQGKLESTTLLIFVAYAFLLSKPLIRLTRHAARMGKLIACGHRIEELIKLRAEESALEMSPLRRSVDLRDVQLFKGAPSLPDVSFDPGDRVLVIGPKGAGKTALMNLIAQRATPARGRVSWDGLDLESLSDRSLDAGIGHLPQLPKWSKMPIGEFLGLGEEIGGFERDVLERLGLTRLLAELPGGLDCTLASTQLSFGERRLLALARALLLRSPLIVLDDPFSSFQEEHTALVLKSLQGCAHGTTVFLSSRIEPKGWAWTRRIELRAGRIVGDVELGAGRRGS